jgi:hypothetical protein
LVKDQVATGRRISEFLYAIRGGFDGRRCTTPQHATGFDPENIVRNHDRSSSGTPLF